MGLLILVWFLFMLSHMLVFVHGGISVQFKTVGPLYVALGETLVLEAVFMKNPEDKIDIVTWEVDNGKENVRISVDPNTDKISFEKDKALLRIKRIISKDFGIYKVTVTDSNGHQKQASKEVRKIAIFRYHVRNQINRSGFLNCFLDDPPTASIVHVLDCCMDTSGVIQWDVPQFSWLVDGNLVTNQTALLSNGSKLDISQVTGYNYTCVIRSSLGTSVASYLTAKHTEESKECCSSYSGLITLSILLALILCVAGWFYIRKRCQTRHSSVSGAQ
ncbi:uncharacterized protein [Paramisgurnus dabryanus]|uniref:uncharacterized protein isoform X1 n=1 Tax=Paramisgurnus dabryanus TaxID=90735 RepID=UPI0031F34710